ncbi:unnamed protein product, partial [Porites evermanni]
HQNSLPSIPYSTLNFLTTVLSHVVPPCWLWAIFLFFTQYGELIINLKWNKNDHAVSERIPDFGVS